MFTDVGQIDEQRKITNREWCEKVIFTRLYERTLEIVTRLKIILFYQKKESSANGLLTWEEESLLCAHYLRKLLEFCNLFQPAIPRAALVS